jgi:hypothetical protein
MSRHLLLIAGSACLLLAGGQAYAGQCTQEIGALEKALSSKDAGMGPTDTGMAESSGDAQTAEVPTAGELPETEATPAMNEATQGKATSPEDVQRQNTGEPTAAEAAQAEQTAPAAGSQSEVTDPLQRARELDKAGKEEECLAAVSEAKQNIGIQ